MRLNFQQQKPINLSAGGPSFVPDQSREADQEANIRLQMINEQQQALKDMAQAAVMIAKANQQAKEAEQQSDLADARLKIIKVRKDIELGVDLNKSTDLNYQRREEGTSGYYRLDPSLSGYYKYSDMNKNQDATTSWLKEQVISDYEAEGDERFAKALEREVEEHMAIAFGNAKKAAIKHTKNNLLNSVNKDNENFFRLVDEQKTIQGKTQAIQSRYSAIGRQLEGTLSPLEITKAQDKWLADSIKQTVTKLSGPDSTAADHFKYDLLLEDGIAGKGVFENSNPLFWLNLDRDAGNRINGMKRTKQIALQNAAVDYDPRKYIQNFLGKNSLEIKVEDGKVKVNYKPRLKNGAIDPEWASHFAGPKGLYPRLTDEDFRRLLKRSTDAIQKEENDKLGKIDFKGEERNNFFEDVKSWYDYYTNLYFTKSDGLNRTTQALPVAPWDKSDYKDINTPEYRSVVAQLEIMEGIFEEGDSLMSMSKNEINNPAKIKKKLDDLLIFVNNKAFKVYSEGVREAAIKFVNTLQAKINATLAPLENPLNTGKKKADVIIEKHGLNPNDPLEVKIIKKKIKPPAVLKK